jgi:hypothetical protein
MSRYPQAQHHWDIIQRAGQTRLSLAAARCGFGKWVLGNGWRGKHDLTGEKSQRVPPLTVDIRKTAAPVPKESLPELNLPSKGRLGWSMRSSAQGTQGLAPGSAAAAGGDGGGRSRRATSTPTPAMPAGYQRHC